jgi:tricorn protease
MRASRRSLLAFLLLPLFVLAAAIQLPAQSSDHHIFQRPALSKNLICFAYADDLWTVPRSGGKAQRLTTGVGIETAPIFSPDGSTIAFTGDYDGNTDVFTIPAGGGVPFRVTYHPAPDFAVAWSPDGKEIVFRSTRESASRYTQLYTVAAKGGVAKALPLPMAYQGAYSPDGKEIAYSPLSPGFGFNYTSYVAWGNYHGGLAGSIWITTLPALDSLQVPHEKATDYSPVYAGGSIYFLSGRNGPITIFKYDPAKKTVTEVLKSEGSDIRTLSGEGDTLVYDQLGEIYLFDTATGKSHHVAIDLDADMPEVRPHIESVADQIENARISPTGLRAVLEAHGDIFTVAAKHGPTRDITDTPGAMEREPAWSPDGQSIAYFSDESGLYQLVVAPQTGNAVAGAAAAKKFPLASDPTYYFHLIWSPDSKKIAFYDNRKNTWILDTATGKMTQIGEKNIYGGFSSESYDMSWAPDSKWLAYTRSMPNHLHAIYVYSLDTGNSTQATSEMGESTSPAFDREGKYLYFIASTNAGAASDGLDMTSDLYQVTANIYAIALAKSTPSPIAPELDDEKPASGDQADKKPDAGDHADHAADAASDEKPHGKAAPPKPVKIDLDGIESRAVALPLPASVYTGVVGGLKSSVYFLERPTSSRFGERGMTLSRWTQEDRKTEKLAERVESFELSANGEKMLLALGRARPEGAEAGPGGGGPPTWVIAPANAPVKPGEGTLNMADLKLKVVPHEEWAQMYHEVWRIERAFFYNPEYNGVKTDEDEKRFAPWVQSIASRADLNYIFQEMLSAFSVGHLRGTGGAIPEGKHVPGGLLGADYVIKNNRYCIAKIYTGGDFNDYQSAQSKAPLAQPGLNVNVGDCILDINGRELTAETDIQEPLEGTAGQVISLRIGSADGTSPRDINVIPILSEAGLRNRDWIDSNQKKVSELSGGKLAYVYLPDTGAGGFTNFNRYYFAQTNKQGAIIDERFNGGGQVADYFIEVLGRHIESYWAPRYGTIEHTPNAAVYGPKVMIANEFSGSGGDALPWLFKQAKLGPLVGKRTWGGLVGIGQIPVLMDGGHVTSPSVAFFSPQGEWDVENHGVEPDYAVEQDPKAVSEGHDPQLEKAVALALDQLKANPPTEVKRPPYPNYHNTY